MNNFKRQYVVLALLAIICFVLFYTHFINSKENMQGQSHHCKKCCLYSYYEKDDKYKKNFEFFLSNAILEDVDYYIIINGDSTVEIPEKNNIRVFTRENKGYDFGAYSHALKNMEHIYDYYFFINTSVIGPYLDNREPSKDWTDYFIELFNNDSVKVVGTSINVYEFKQFGHDLTELYGDKPVYPHVQSMFFCIKHDYLEYLNSVNFFNEEELNDKDITYVVAYKEFGLSQIALNKGWNINCILEKYRDLDYLQIDKNENVSSSGGDPYYKNSYFGKTIQEEDVIFFKNARL